jgi:hypothetical protein
VTLYAAPTTRMTSSSGSVESKLILKALPCFEGRIYGGAVPHQSMAVTVGSRDSTPKRRLPASARWHSRSIKGLHATVVDRQGIALWAVLGDCNVLTATRLRAR